MIQLLLGSSGGAKQSETGPRCIRGKMSEGKIPTLRGGVSVTLRVPRCASKVLWSVSRGVGCASRDVSKRDGIRCASEMRWDSDSNTSDLSLKGNDLKKRSEAGFTLSILTPHL